MALTDFDQVVAAVQDEANQIYISRVPFVPTEGPTRVHLDSDNAANQTVQALYAQELREDPHGFERPVRNGLELMNASPEFQRIAQSITKAAERQRFA